MIDNYHVSMDESLAAYSIEADVLIKKSKEDNREKYLFTTKKGDDVFLFNHSYTEEIFYIKIFHVWELNPLKHLLYLAYHIINDDEGNRYIRIENMQCYVKNQSQGYGTVCMNFLLMVAEKNKAKYISGSFSSQSIEPGKILRLLNYYRKFKFNIDLDADGATWAFYLVLDAGLPLTISQMKS